MSEVKQYDIAAYNGGMDEIVDGNYVLFSDFDRVTAERDAALADLKAMGERYQKDLILSRERWCYGNRADAKIAELQQRLTAADERADVLEGLVGEVLDAVGREPLDLDAVLRLRARMRAALKPAEVPYAHSG